MHARMRYARAIAIERAREQLFRISRVSTASLSICNVLVNVIRLVLHNKM